MRCNQCNMVFIQAGPFKGNCHEAGCPNERSRYDEDSDSWIRQFECQECGCMADADAGCDCMEPVEAIWLDEDDLLD